MISCFYKRCSTLADSLIVIFLCLLSLLVSLGQGGEASHEDGKGGESVVSALGSPATRHLENGGAGLDGQDNFTMDSIPTTLWWNKTALTPWQYRSIYCQHGCVDTWRVYMGRGGCTDVTCAQCSCNKPACQIYGTCCPDINVHSNPDLRKSSDTSYLEGHPDTHTDNNKALTDTATGNRLNYTIFCDPQYNILYVRSCPSQFLESDVRAKCEMDTPVDKQDLATFTRVTSNETGVTFYNKYCARCHEELEFTEWRLSIVCQHYQHVYTAVSYDDFLRQALGPDSQCHARQVQPFRDKNENCQVEWFDENINTCNVSGDWKDYDEDVVLACQYYTSTSDRVSIKTANKTLYYNNIFCAICNMENYPAYNTTCDRSPKEDTRSSDFSARLPFSMLLNLRSSSEANNGRKLTDDLEKKGCLVDSQWPSPDGRCLPLHCAPGKRLAGGTCETVIAEIRGLEYRVRLMFFPDVNLTSFITTHGNQSAHNLSLVMLSVIKAYFQSYLEQIENTLAYATHARDTKYSVLFSREFGSNESPVPVDGLINMSAATAALQHCQWVYFLDTYLKANTSLSRDEFENYIVQNLITPTLKLTVNEKVKGLSLVPHLLSETEEEFSNCTNGEKRDWLGHLNLYYCDNSSQPGFSSLSAGIQKSCSRGRRDNYATNRATKSYRDDVIGFSLELTCPVVSFNASLYTLKHKDVLVAPFRSISLQLDWVTLTFSGSHDLNLLSIDQGGKLRVCQDLLNLKTDQIMIIGENSVLVLVQYILTLVSVSASILCLVITLMTYAIFSGLRSVAGKNSMMLSATLMLAQISLLVSSHTTTQGHVCTVIGMSTHLLWLSMFCWCWICCCHMFRVFTSQTRSVQPSTARAQTIYLAQRIIFCLAVPALIVITVVVSSLLTSGHQRIGYGHNSCYLDSAVLVAISMVTPLGLVLLCNCTFFTLTVIKIHQVRKLQTHQNFHSADRQNLYVYIKLSTMTGLFWSIAVVAEATDNDPLRFVAIIFNGLQGVFIFLSYICNKRVLKLYSRALGYEDNATATSVTDKGTVSKMADAVKETGSKSDPTNHARV